MQRSKFPVIRTHHVATIFLEQATRRDPYDRCVKAIMADDDSQSAQKTTLNGLPQPTPNIVLLVTKSLHLFSQKSHGKEPFLAIFLWIRCVALDSDAAQGSLELTLFGFGKSHSFLGLIHENTLYRCHLACAMNWLTCVCEYPGVW